LCNDIIIWFLYYLLYLVVLLTIKNKNINKLILLFFKENQNNDGVLP
jgi:hypothetical protein